MIISISGDINSGKDTVTKIIQVITAMPYLNNTGILKALDRPITSKWENKKWADKLKDIVCILLGCTREQLEDREFKEKELDSNWWYFKDGKELISFHKATTQQRIDLPLVQLTPRMLLQLIGTECGRKIIHPNIWVNALMSEYKAKGTGAMLGSNVIDYSNCEFPNWIISDTRFPNEIKTVRNYEHITVNIVRNSNVKKDRSLLHESETALDNYTKWDWEICNNGDIDYLIDEVRRFLAKFNIK